MSSKILQKFEKFFISKISSKIKNLSKYNMKYSLKKNKQMENISTILEIIFNYQNKI